MGSGRHFNRNNDLFFALSVVQFCTAKSSTGVCCRLRQGNSTPENLVDNIDIAMRNIRGSAPYWSRACLELIAMIKSLRPSSWFISFSCNNLNWPGLLEALCVADGQENVNISELTFGKKSKFS